MKNFLLKVREIKGNIEDIWSTKTKLWNSDRLALAIIPGVVVVAFIAIERVKTLWQFFFWIFSGIVIVYLFFTLLVCIIQRGVK